MFFLSVLPLLSWTSLLLFNLWAGKPAAFNRLKKTQVCHQSLQCGYTTKQHLQIGFELLNSEISVSGQGSIFFLLEWITKMWHSSFWWVLLWLMSLWEWKVPIKHREEGRRLVHSAHQKSEVFQRTACMIFFLLMLKMSACHPKALSHS